MLLTIGYALGLESFVGDDLRYALLDKDGIIAETDHRMRNVLQIAMGLSATAPAAEGRELLRLQLRALRHVQDAVDASPDLTRLGPGSGRGRLAAGLCLAIPPPPGSCSRLAGSSRTRHSSRRWRAWSSS